MAPANQRSGKMKKAKIGAIFVILALVFNPAGAEMPQVQNPGYLPASNWVRLDKADRALYVAGFLAGVDIALRSVGNEIRVINPGSCRMCLKRYICASRLTQNFRPSP
jgi:hypothetical protein